MSSSSHCCLITLSFSSEVKLDIFNYEEVKSSANVMGVIRGSVEPGEKCSNLLLAVVRFPASDWCSMSIFFFYVHRQICALWEPQGQLGPRRRRSEQRDIGHAGIDQGAGENGQAG